MKRIARRGSLPVSPRWSAAISVGIVAAASRLLLNPPADLRARPNPYGDGRAAIASRRFWLRCHDGSSSDRQLVLFSSADWHTPYWTNKQHIAKRLADRGWSVLYVETVGLRAPALARLDGGRMLRRLRAAATSPRRVKEGLWVASPVTLPFGHRFAAVQRFNARKLGSALRRWLRLLDFHRPVIWTYHPFMMDAIAGLDRCALVYHCVDELSAVPGIDPIAFRREENRLLRSADLVFASSPALRDKCAAVSQATHYLPNVADIGHFAAARDPGRCRPSWRQFPGRAWDMPGC